MVVKVLLQLNEKYDNLFGFVAEFRLGVDRMLMLEDVVLLGGYVTELDLAIKVNES